LSELDDYHATSEYLETAEDQWPSRRVQKKVTVKIEGSREFCIMIGGFFNKEILRANFIGQTPRKMVMGGFDL